MIDLLIMLAILSILGGFAAMLLALAYWMWKEAMKNE